MAISCDRRIFHLAAKIVDKEVRSLFIRFIEEVCNLSDTTERKFTPFTIRVTDPSGINVQVVPYRDIFLVVVGEAANSEMRVSDREGFVTALDMSLHHFLKKRLYSVGD